jgi:hypothetical protein
MPLRAETVEPLAARLELETAQIEARMSWCFAVPALVCQFYASSAGAVAPSLQANGIGVFALRTPAMKHATALATEF